MIFRTERQFTDAVIDLAKMSAWLVHHDRGDMRQRIQGHGGFFDLVMVKGGRVLFRELKMSPRSPFQPGQQAWLAAVPGSSVWYPSDWPEIVKVLSGAS